MPAHRSLIFTVLLAAGCQEGGPVGFLPDLGASTVDGGAADAEPSSDAQEDAETSAVDAGVADPADADARADADAPDVGHAPDAGRAPDAGEPPDASGRPDAAPLPDAGSPSLDAGPPGSCYGAGTTPPSVAPFGFAMPSVADERATYRRLGWSWAPSAQPNVGPDPGFRAEDPDVHYGTEADDLWTSYAMQLRSGQAGYFDRATAWRRYFMEDYRACVGGSSYTYCWDRENFGGDHLWGWGLVAWSQGMSEPAAETEATRLAEEVEALWGPNSPFGCLGRGGCTWYGVRQIGRHLLLVTRVAELTQDQRWEQLRDRIVETLLTSAQWDESLGSYFFGEGSTDEKLGAGAYARGDRIQSTFQLGVLGEAMDHVYRTTGNEEVRRRMVRMASFVERYGLDAQYEYSSSYIGVVGGQAYQSYAGGTVNYWDPVYTTSLVNTLVRGYLYTCEPHYYEAAARFFIRGNGGIYGEPTRRSVMTGEIDHFVDSRFDSSSGNFFFDRNKGELQYTYLLFDPARHP